jgi:hypothetical protein
MRTCTRCGEAKPEGDFYFHAKRGRYEARCKGCFKTVVKASADAKRPEVREANRLAGVKFRDANRERENVRVLAAYHANREERLAANRAWRVANPDKHAAKEARRRAAKLRATPAWADLGAIAKVYWLASEESRRTGVLMHVDHIVPLKGKNVCGLHCEANLQILPALANISKGNRFRVDTSNLDRSAVEGN